MIRSVEGISSVTSAATEPTQSTLVKTARVLGQWEWQRGVRRLWGDQGAPGISPGWPLVVPFGSWRDSHSTETCLQLRTRPARQQVRHGMWRWTWVGSKGARATARANRCTNVQRAVSNVENGWRKNKSCASDEQDAPRRDSN